MFNVPVSGYRLNVGLSELAKVNEVNNRRLYLFGEILSVDSCEDEFDPYVSPTSMLVKQILSFNKADIGLAPAKREPIILYINSPGGELIEGFPLISAIELSKTPVYTVNVGEWCSMAFLIGITGHKRFSLPYMTFLMHEASGAMVGKISDMEAKLDFDKRFNRCVTREHILRHSTMDATVYDAVCKSEFYMLTDEALKYGFIDEIVTDIDTIL